MLPPSVQQRVTKIQDVLRKERAAVDKLSDVKALKPMLAEVSLLLDLVEGGFLSKEDLSRQRAANEWSYWLGGAEKFLEIAIRQRKFVAGLVAKHGSDLRIISGT
jgi:hypothetical protein